MAVITVDYDQEAAKNAAEGGSGWQGYPDGKYVLQVLSHETKPPKSSDKSPTTWVKAKIVWSFNGQNLEKPTTLFMSHHPRSVPYNLLRFLRAMGVPVTDHGNGRITFDPDHMIGGKVEGTLKNKAGEQRNQENWDNWAPVGGVVQPAQTQIAPQTYQQPMQPMQQMAPQQMPQQTFGPPNGGWQPPAQPQQMPGNGNGGYPQQQPQVAPGGYGNPPPQYQQQPQQPQMAPPNNAYPQQQPTYQQQPAQQPVYQQQPAGPQVAPQPQGAPAWMQPGLPRGNG